MSLIADSLKKVLKAKEAKRTNGPEFNVISENHDIFKTPKLETFFRSAILIILPGTLLVFLVYHLTFDKTIGITFRNLLFWERLANRSQTPEPQPIKLENSLEFVPQPEPVKKTPKPLSVNPEIKGKKTIELASKTKPTVIKKHTAVGSPQFEVLDEASPTIVLSPKKSKAKPAIIKRKPRVAFKPIPREHPSPLSDIMPPKLIVESQTTRSPRLNIQKDYLFFYNRGVFFQGSGDYEKALLNYRKALELNPRNPEIHNNIGLVLKELKHFEDALEEFMQTILLEPKHTMAYNNMGVIYYIQGNLKGALSNYQKALEINPKNLETYNNIGAIYKNQQWLKKAESVYNKAFSLNPKHPGTNYNLGLFYEELNNIPSAIYFYRRFIEFGVSSHPLLTSQVRNHLRNLEHTN